MADSATITYTLAVCLFTLDVRIKKPAYENLMNYNRQKKHFLKRVRILLLVAQQWIPGVVSVSAQ